MKNTIDDGHRIKNFMVWFLFVFFKSTTNQLTFVAELQSTLHIYQGHTQIFKTQITCHTVQSTYGKMFYYVN